MGRGTRPTPETSSARARPGLAIRWFSLRGRHPGTPPWRCRPNGRQCGCPLRPCPSPARGWRRSQAGRIRRCAPARAPASLPKESPRRAFPDQCPEHLEVHRLAERLQLIAEIAQPLQAVIEIEKAGQPGRLQSPRHMTKAITSLLIRRGFWKSSPPDEDFSSKASFKAESNVDNIVYIIDCYVY